MQLGQIVRVLKGRGIGKHAIVIGFKSPQLILIADGKDLKAEKPKVKNIKHVQQTNTIAVNVASMLKLQDAVKNIDLRKDLNGFSKKL